MTLTPAVLAELRIDASARLAGKTPAYEPEPEMRLRPAVVLALLDRIEALEAALRVAEPRCGCGRVATVRGDPECSGCSQDCYFCKCDPQL